MPFPRSTSACRSKPTICSALRRFFIIEPFSAPVGAREFSRKTWVRIWGGIVFCDELEKALANAGSSSQTDSGVTARVFGSLLTWLSDHQSDVFFIGTSNDISKLPPEFARAERFDGTFFIGLPAQKQREAIWEIYIQHYGLDAKQAKPDDTGWTGAEIKSYCRLASLLDVPLVQASLNVVPVSVTARDKVEELRAWASGRVLSADQPGIYSRPEQEAGNARTRRVMREPGRS
jgi:hypothetical protein